MYSKLLTGGQLISSKIKVLIIQKHKSVSYLVYSARPIVCKRILPVSGQFNDVPRVSAAWFP